MNGLGTTQIAAISPLSLPLVGRVGEQDLAFAKSVVSLGGGDARNWLRALGPTPPEPALPAHPPHQGEGREVS